MEHLSYITTFPSRPGRSVPRIPTDESVCALLFDTSGFSRPFDAYPTIYTGFRDNKARPVTNMTEAAILGIGDNGFLNGMPYHHLSEFFSIVGEGQVVYLVFADCSNGWDVIDDIQRQTGGRLFQVGVWTSQKIWSQEDDGSLAFTPLIASLQAQADEVNGKTGATTQHPTPLNILLFGNSHYEGSYKKIPDATILGCPSVSVVLAQNGSSQTHAMQSANPQKAPVGALGLVMGCVAKCGAEESIASVRSCDLNINEGFNYPEWGVGDAPSSIDNIQREWARTASSYGYIVPIDYDGIESSYFLSSDRTLGTGDLGTLSNSRILHKCRRAVCTALLPYVHASHIYNPGTHNISPTSIAIITDSINTILDSVMRNKKGFKQLNGRSVNFIESLDDVIDTDEISLRLDVVPAGSSTSISEYVSHEMS